MRSFVSWSRKGMRKGRCHILVNIEKDVGKVCVRILVKSKFNDKSKGQIFEVKVLLLSFSESNLLIVAQWGQIETSLIGDSDVERRREWTSRRVDIDLKS